MALTVAVDIGGTFTDLLACDDAAGRLFSAKSATTPGNFAAAIEDCLAKASLPAATIDTFVHGSTVAINTVIERTGAPTALVVTRGTRDIYAIGRGNRPAEFAGYRVPQEESRERFDECVEVMTRAWTEERVTFEGRFFTVPGVSVIPKPVQRPHPPLYQVCVSKDGIENTALRGWPMLNSVLFGPVDQLVENRDVYVDALRKTGRTDAEVTSLLRRWGVSRQIYVAPTDAQALAEAKDAEMWYQESFRKFVIPERIEDSHPTLQPAFRAMAERLSKITWEGLVAETLAFGSPETVARHIEQMRQIGVGQVLCWMNFGGLPEDRVRRSMELFAREVMPRFR